MHITRAKLSCLMAILLLASTGLSQKKPERPKLHSDFYFGTYPLSRDAISMMAKENARLLLVGFHQGWDMEKIAKESGVKEEDLDKLFADMEEARLAVEIDQYERRPMLPVIRDRDLDRIEKDLQTHTDEYAKLLQTRWSEIEETAASMAGAQRVPKKQLLYQIVVGGILFGSMNDAFFEDQTIMVNPPRRQGSQRYYAWLVEGDPALAGILKREQWESEGYTMVSIGPTLQESRTGLDQVRTDNGMILEDAEARRFRSFLTIFAKDKLLPYFKKNRSDFLKVLNELDAGRYVRVSDAFAWYYDQMANGAARQLVEAGLIQPPDVQFVYAMKAPLR